MANQSDVEAALEDELQYRILLTKQILCNEAIDADSPDDMEGWCPRIWDGIMCWPPTQAASLRELPCPDYFDGFKPHELASRYCTPNATWYFNPVVNQEWTNYSACGYSIEIVPMDNTTLIEYWLPVIRRISQVGYGVSLITLLFALFILAYFKKLHCPRNTLHMHLFCSFIMRAFMALLKDNLFLNSIDLVQSLEDPVDSDLLLQHLGSWYCKLITGLWQYFIMANYAWILMEGLYLHNLIFMALFTDSSAITVYIVLGWGLPFLFVSPWIILKALKDNIHCWTTNVNSDIFWLIRGPIIASIVINFIFFMHITWVLLSKLRSSVSAETRKYRYRKWAKSTLVLVPLFGVHYFVFIGMSFAIDHHTTVELVWLFCDQSFASFQGCLVAILYCLMNAEVRGEISRRWKRWRQDRHLESPWSQYSITNHSRSTRWRTSLQSLPLTSVAERRDQCRLGSLTPPMTIYLTSQVDRMSSNVLDTGGTRSQAGSLNSSRSLPKTNNAASPNPKLEKIVSESEGDAENVDRTEVFDALELRNTQL